MLEIVTRVFPSRNEVGGAHGRRLTWGTYVGRVTRQAVAHERSVNGHGRFCEETARFVTYVISGTPDSAPTLP
jgi:hypothetical protein